MDTVLFLFESTPSKKFIHLIFIILPIISEYNSLEIQIFLKEDVCLSILSISGNVSKPASETVLTET
jgi:hypothetical protein